jgi:hypothetical protein
MAVESTAIYEMNLFGFGITNVGPFLMTKRMHGRVVISLPQTFAQNTALCQV